MVTVELIAVLTTHMLIVLMRRLAVLVLSSFVVAVDAVILLATVLLKFPLLYQTVGGVMRPSQ
jgi:hypothetical protein